MWFPVCHSSQIISGSAVEASSLLSPPKLAEMSKFTAIMLPPTLQED